LSGPEAGEFAARIVDQVADAVVALTQPIAIIVTGQFLGSVQSRSGAQSSNLLDNSSSVGFRVDASNIFRGRGLQQQFIFGHAA
jgi:hypothetical protein